MALIKCLECGKEISDKANTCPNCGCPTNLSLEKIQPDRKHYKKEQNIYKTIIDTNHIKDLEITIDIILFIFSFIMGNVITMDFPSIESFVYGIIIFIPFLLITLYIFNNRKNSYLIITTENIKGEILGLGKIEIYIPLEKIDSISVIKSITGNEGLHISSSITNYSISYIKNAQQFKNVVLDLINGKDVSKYKIEESDNNDIKSDSTFFNRHKFLIIGLIIIFLLWLLLIKN